MTADVDLAAAEAARAEVEQECRELSDALMTLQQRLNQRHVEYRLLQVDRDRLRERLDEGED